MTDKKSNESRRKLLKSIAAGSGTIVAGKSLPESWSRPVVDSVMLPAHAETSITGTYSDIDIPLPTMNGSLVYPGQDNLVADFFNFFIPEAKAGGPTFVGMSACATVGASFTEVELRQVVSGDTVCDQVGYSEYTLNVKATIPSGEGNVGPAKYSSPCPGDLPVIQPSEIKIVRITSSEIIIEFSGGGQITLPESPCRLIAESCVEECLEEIVPDT